MNISFSSQDYMLLWLSVAGVGFKTLAKIDVFLRKQNLSWKQIWQRPSVLLSLQVISMKQFLAVQEYKKSGWSVEVLRRRLAEENIFVVYKNDGLYPQLLREIDQPPPVLFVRGNVDLLAAVGNTNSVAVVGTRKNTPYGKLVTNKITAELVAHQTIIVSGGMYGIDATAHRACIENNGKTIAVLGSGIAYKGPYWQQLLCQRIIDSGGVVLSEFFPWQAAQKGFFPQRNRVVAGLSNATVVTEAAARSGSLITAQFALDSGREVCAVPGSITNQYAAGTAWLVNQGATLVSSGIEVLKTFDHSFLDVKNKRTAQLKLPHSKVITIIANNIGISTEKVAAVLNCSVPTVLEKLSDLEVKKQVVSQGQRWFLNTY